MERLITPQFAKQVEQRGAEVVKRYRYEKFTKQVSHDLRYELNAVVNDARQDFPNEFEGYMVRVTDCAENNSIRAMIIFCTKKGEYVVQWEYDRLGYQINSREYTSEGENG